MASSVFIKWLATIQNLRMEKIKTYSDPSEVELPNSFPIIWLASWYPSKTAVDNGDFIQRHAEAVSVIQPLLVIHSIHNPYIAEECLFEVHQKNNLTEIIIYFRQTEADSLYARIQYNLKFHQYTKRLLGSLFKKYGQPAALHVHVPLKMGRIALWAKKKWGIPFLVSEQSSKYIGDDKDQFDKRSSFYKSEVKRVFQQAIAITNVSQTIALVLEKKFHLKKIRVIHNVVDTSLFFYKGEKAARSPFQFLHASTLAAHKNPKGLINAFCELYTRRQDFELVVIGGQANSELLSENFKAPWLKWEGYQPHSQVPGYMNWADAFVLFSWSENFPCVTVEALCTGIPVICSNAGGCAEAISRSNGIVVTPGDEHALVDALNSIIEKRDDYEGYKISKAAALRYSYGKIGHDFVQQYRELRLIPG